MILVKLYLRGTNLTKTKIIFQFTTKIMETGPHLSKEVLERFAEMHQSRKRSTTGNCFL